MTDNLVTRPAGRSIRDAEPMNAQTVAAHMWGRQPAYAKLRVTTTPGGHYAVITCEHSHQYAIRSDGEEFAYGATHPNGNPLDSHDGLRLGSALDAYDGLCAWVTRHALRPTGYAVIDETSPRAYQHPADEVTL